MAQAVSHPTTNPPMSKKTKKDKNIKKFSLSKDDLANLYGRLKVTDYMTVLVNKDIYEYIRTVIFKRQAIGPDWAIIHDPSWKTITVISPEEKVQHEMATTVEKQETGKEPPPLPTTVAGQEDKRA